MLLQLDVPQPPLFLFLTVLFAPHLSIRTYSEFFKLRLEHSVLP